MRTFAWTTLIVGGCAAVIYCLVYYGGPPGFAAAIVSVLTWVAFGTALAHFTGMKRPVVKHFGGRFNARTAQSISHTVSANDRPNLQLALNSFDETIGAATVNRAEDRARASQLSRELRLVREIRRTTQ